MNFAGRSIDYFIRVRLRSTLRGLGACMHLFQDTLALSRALTTRTVAFSQALGEHHIVAPSKYILGMYSTIRAVVWLEIPCSASMKYLSLSWREVYS